MDYHCLNILLVKGSKQDIERLARRLLKPATDRLLKPGEEPIWLLHFDGIMPMLENAEVSLTIKKAGAEGLTPEDRWRIRHWGTRGKPRTCYVRIKAHLLWVCFETAWSPPEGIYKAIQKSFPRLRLQTHSCNTKVDL